MKVKLFTQATVNFNVNDKPYSFDIATNIVELGLDIEDAVISWVHRTRDYSVESFCTYVCSKDVAHICFPYKEEKK